MTLTVAWLHLPTAPPTDALLDRLSSAEQQRAAQILHPAAQRRFVVGRAALRGLLGAQLGLTPAHVPLELDRHGKPFCTGACAFNLSHSGDYVLLGWGSVAALGVDVEQIRSTPEQSAVARRIMTPQEYAAWLRLPVTQRAAAFTRLWAAKEALIKGDGQGFGLEPAHVAAGWQQQRRTVQVAGRTLQLLPLAAPLGYAAALSVDGSPDALRCLQITRLTRF